MTNLPNITEITSKIIYDITHVQNQHKDVMAILPRIRVGITRALNGYPDELTETYLYFKSKFACNENNRGVMLFTLKAISKGINEEYPEVHMQAIVEDEDIPTIISQYIRIQHKEISNGNS